MNQIFKEASKKGRRESRRQSVDPGKDIKRFFPITV